MTGQQPVPVFVQGALKVRHTCLWLYYFVRFVLRQFGSRRGPQTAAALAYTTLLSIVPLVGVMFSFFGNLPVFKDISDVVQEFVFGNFVPAFGETVREHLIGFSLKASHLTATGIVILMVIALLMLSTIESALNHIWNVSVRRSRVGRFLVYWAILTLGPILLGISLYATSYVLALPVVSSVDASLMLRTRILSVLPFFTTSIAFTLMYVLVPNCHVSHRDAAIGGLTAALFFEIAKYMFGVYVKSVPTYEMIYGAIAVIPLFLVWIYLSCVIVLLGAQIAYCLSVFRLEHVAGQYDKSRWDFFDVYRVLAELWEAQKTGQSLTATQIKRRGLRIPHTLLNEILEILARARWIERVPGGRLMLSRDLHEVTLLDLHHLLPCKFPEKPGDGSDIWQQTLAEALGKYEQGLQESLAVPLGELFRKTTTAPSD